MNADSLRIRWFYVGILMVLLLSALPRFLSLDERPLDNVEAVHALNATQLTPDPATYWPEVHESQTTSPLYEWLTGLIFQFSGSGNGAARSVPAVGGFFLALLPLIFLRRTPRITQLLSAAFLALSPVAITISRTSGGASMSALFVGGFALLIVMAAQEQISDRYWIWAAIFLGAALASGESAFTGLLSVLLVYPLARWLTPDALRIVMPQGSGRKLLGYLWVTPLAAVLLATGLGLYRFGMAGLGEALVAWLRGWIPFGQLSALGFILAGITYEPYILIVGIVGIIITRKRVDSLGRIFSIWALSSLSVGLIYPGRSAQDLIWLVIPLGFVAAEAIAVLLERLAGREVWLHVVSLVLIALVLVSAAVVTLIGYVNGYLQQMLAADSILIGLALFAMLLLLTSVFVLFGLGWSWDIVWDGAGIVLALLTMGLSVSAAWNLAGDRGLGFRTLWTTSSPTLNGVYFDATLQNASLALTGDRTAAPVYIQGEPDPALVWRLRKYPRFESTDTQNAATPPILIAPEGTGLSAYGAEYFGQGFALTFERGWFGLVPPDVLRWWLTHSAPSASTGWVIFIRADIIAIGDFPTEPPLE